MITTVVIKTNRACNLRCGYCYYINEATERYGETISLDTVEMLYHHLSDHVPPDQSVRLIWHGGEPMMIGPRRFLRFLELQREYFKRPPLNSIQTNGTIWNPAWIELIQHYSVEIGLSIDGPADVHNRKRPDIRGRGTFGALREFTDTLNYFEIPWGALTVVADDFVGAGYFKTLDLLGASSCDLLPVMRFHGAPDTDETARIRMIAEVLRLYREWRDHWQDRFLVRLFASYIGGLAGHPSVFANTGMSPEAFRSFVVLETDGSICTDVEFSEIERASGAPHYTLGRAVFDRDFSFANVVEELDRRDRMFGLTALSEGCLGCDFSSACGGGHPGSRYSLLRNDFQSRSAHCDLMAALGITVRSDLQSIGYGGN
ncbi:radical SAM protein [Palleronia abyssalis]|uniref:Anaerobic sulfatase-maturating enzyme n=1 Tax=Palleronia abyssalis TaxID=1501240 RepID=A0A2R8BQZ1_9RHOB|nr:radical SAM protein [Palleronia abyssalis]SPJ22577.1 Anaerobic sulfatase-maturating enzyme [Palleronia abyssalis]